MTKLLVTKYVIILQSRRLFVNTSYYFAHVRPCPRANALRNQPDGSVQPFLKFIVNYNYALNSDRIQTFR